MADALAKLGQVSVLGGLGVLCLFAVQLFIASRRWMKLTQDAGNDIHFVDFVRATWIGAFFNQFLPSSIGGDVVRAWSVHRKGISVSAAIQSVLLDRLAGLMGLWVVMAVTLPLLFEIAPGPVERTAVGAFILAGCIGLTTLWLLRNIAQDRVSHAAGRWLIQLVNAAYISFVVSRRAVVVLSLSIAVQCISVFVIYILASVIGSRVGIIECLVLVPPVLLMSAIPISIAGWGVREGAMVFALRLIGVPPTDALAISVLFGLFLIAISLPGGLVWLLSRHQRIAQVEKEMALGGARIR